MVNQQGNPGIVAFRVREGDVVEEIGSSFSIHIIPENRRSGGLVIRSTKVKQELLPLGECLDVRLDAKATDDRSNH